MSSPGARPRLHWLGWSLAVAAFLALPLPELYSGGRPLLGLLLSSVISDPIFMLKLLVDFIAKCLLYALGISVVPALVITRLGARPIHRAGFASAPPRPGRGLGIGAATFALVLALTIATHPEFYLLYLPRAAPGALFSRVVSALLTSLSFTAVVALLTLRRRRLVAGRPTHQRALTSASEAFDAT